MFVKYWIPEIKANDSGTNNIAEIDYLKCEEDGWVTVTEGDMTKYDDILAELLEFNNKFTIRNIYFDAWNISYFYEQMEKNGLPAYKYNGSISNLSPPTKRVAEMIHTKDIDFGMNPITRWMFSNVELIEKGPGLVKLTRTNKKKKIDGVISSVMAMAAYTNYRLQNKPFNPQIIVL
jgi:phage terminase large subunit-like protein